MFYLACFLGTFFEKYCKSGSMEKVVFVDVFCAFFFLFTTRTKQTFILHFEGVFLEKAVGFFEEKTLC